MKKKNNLKISVIGLGYVGLPLALLLSKKNLVIGYDNNLKKIKLLKKKIDITKEIKKKVFNQAKNIIFSSNETDLQNSDFFIIAVPTPINKYKKPDLSLLINATKLVAKYIQNKSIVILESTVYPGTTEEICVPILKKISSLEYIDSNKKNLKTNGFYCGYCPERVNPGDKIHTIDKITKVISGSNKLAIRKIKNLYSSICKEVYISNSIKTAEAAKIIENTQRDLNIALVNELSKIFNLLNIDTGEVINTASTKWNFAKFYPGLVGGHCIGVDPYYLTYKAKKIGFKPNVILAGRKINDGMVNYVIQNIIKKYKEKKIKLQNSRALFIGCSFKKNVTDIRNSKSIELIDKIKNFKIKIDIFDPIVNEKNIVNIDVIKEKHSIKHGYYDLLVFSVVHDKYKEFLAKNYQKFLKRNKNIIIDLDGCLQKHNSDFRL